MMLSRGLHRREKPLVLNGPMQPIDIADSLDRFHWEALRALGAPSPDPSRLSEAVLSPGIGPAGIPRRPPRDHGQGPPRGRLRLAAAVEFIETRH